MDKQQGQIKKNIQTNRKMFLLIGALIAMLVVLIIVSIFQRSVSPQSVSLTNLEQQYPTAKPQSYPGTSNTTGTLVVTSAIFNPTVTIDEDEDKDPNFFAPSNIPPFVVNGISVGKHVIRAQKDGYINRTITVNVQPYQITRVHIAMDKNTEQDSLDKVKTELPVDTDQYHIEYLSGINKIQVTIKQSPFDANKQKAIDWFKQHGVTDPENEGVVFYPALYVK